MALESGNFIPELVETNPDGTDLASTLDDHDRLIKRCVKGSFSGFVGTTATPKSVTLSEDQINDAARKGVSNVFTDINDFRVGGNQALFIDNPAVAGVQVWSRNNEKHLVGFRNPASRDIGSSTSALQSDEGGVLYIIVNNIALTLPQLEAQTTLRVVTLAAATADVRLIPGTGVTITARLGGTEITGNIGIAQSSVAEVYYRSATAVDVFGNGLATYP